MSNKVQKRRYLHVQYALENNMTPPVFKEPGWEKIVVHMGSVTDSLESKLSKLKSQPNSALDAVSFQQGLQKIHVAEITTVLGEFKRILKTEGFLHMTVPDLQFVVDQVKKDLAEDDVMRSPYGPVNAFDVIYGHRNAFKEHGLNGAHLSGFTPSSVGRIVRDSGFYNIRVRREPTQLVIAAHRPKEGFITANEKIRIIDPNMKNGVTDELDIPAVAWKPLNLKQA